MSSNNFRIQAKNIFLTYPQCSLPPSAALRLISILLENKLDYGLCVQEKHEDGNLHLHAVLVMKTKFSTRNERFFDLKVNDTVKHPKIEPVKNLYNAVRYLFKDPIGQVVGYGCNPKDILKALEMKKGVKHVQIAYLITEEGKSIEEINSSFPGYVLQHLQKIRAYYAWNENLKLLKTPKKKWNGVLPYNREVGVRNWEKKIARWINTNFSSERQHRQPQLWVSGLTGSGKTYLLMCLLKYFHGYCVPNDGKWLDGYSDGYDFAYFDEYKGSKTIQFMNGFVEGSHYPCPRRGIEPYVKKKNLPIIICSNYTIQGCYKNADSVVVHALSTRFMEVAVPPGERIELQFEFDESDEDTAEMLSDSELMPNFNDPFEEEEEIEEVIFKPDGYEI